jgi:phage-related protein (TIGR01555 family)
MLYMETPKPNMGIAKVFKERMDGWMNVFSGLGVRGKDKRVSNELTTEFMAEVDAETLYAGDDVAAKIVDQLPEDALREWIEIKGTDQDIEDGVMASLDELGARGLLKEAWSWARMYGGAGLFMSIDDGMDSQEPVKEDRIYSIKSLTLLSRWEIVPEQINSDLESPFFGEPEIYRLQTSQPTDYKERYIHHSRLLRFDGVVLPRRLRIQNQYWGDSVFSRSKNAIQNYNSANDSAISALQDFSVGVFQIKNLSEMVAAGQEQLVRTRLELANLSKSVIKSIVLDMDEKFEHQSKSLSGVPEVLKAAAARLVVASGMPHTKLLGESPSGLGATGDSEERDYYDMVKNQQNIILRPRLDTLLRYILLSKKGPTQGKIPEDWSFDFVPLWQMSDKEQADMEYVVAQKDQIYIQNNVLDPNEVAISRYGGDKFSLDTVVDLDARKAVKPTPFGETALVSGKGPGPDMATPQDPAAPDKMEQTPEMGYVPRTDKSK